MNGPPRPDYAGPVSRTLAYVVDAFVVSAFSGGAAVVMGLVALVVGGGARDLAHAAVSSFVVFLPAFLALYNALFWLLAGRTPGMALLGVRVVRVDGRPVRWLGALVRALVLVCFPIGALWAVVDRRRQAVHDKVAHTTVIRAGPVHPPVPPPPHPAPPPPDAFPGAHSPGMPPSRGLTHPG